jgi:hypothetical protein
MKRTSRVVSTCTAVLLLVLGLGVVTSDSRADIDPSSAVLNTRIFNDCPSSVLTTTNAYPASVAIGDSALGCFGFANLHNWSFSQNGVTAEKLDNSESVHFSATLVISGATNGEAGLRVSPWWSPDVDGRFNVRTTDGEIACFGGRLPFYSFTGSQGVTYTKGTPIKLEVIYEPNGLTSSSPATIEYKLEYPIGTPYTSGALPFDQGNPSEDPPHGVWGMLRPAYAGGYIQCFLVGGNNSAQVRANWTDIQFAHVHHLNLPKIPGLGTWGLVALTALLVAAGSFAMMRRRREVGGAV